MPVLTANDVINAEAPDNLYDSLVIQCQEAKFEISKRSNNPQIIAKWEVLGVKTKDNKISPEIVRNGQTYVLAGLTLTPTYFTLTPKAIRFYRDFWVKATGLDAKEFSVDTENPDLGFFKKLAMSAVVKLISTKKTKPLSDEDADRLREAGLPVVGEDVVDDDGNPLYSKFLQVDTWNKRFTGELPAF